MTSERLLHKSFHRHVYQPIFRLDNVLSASGGGTTYNYSDYRANVLNNSSGTISSSTDYMIKFAGYHLAYAFTYNFPKFNGSAAYSSASPMFLGLELSIASSANGNLYQNTTAITDPT